MGRSIVDKTSLRIDKADLDDLESIGSYFPRAAGQVLIEDTEKSDHVLFLLKGYVKIVIGTPMKAAAIQPPRTFVGEMAVVRDEPRSGRVVALTDVETLVIPGAKFLEYLLTHPRVALELLRDTQERLVHFTRKAAISELGSEMKVAATLVELADTGCGEETEHGTRLWFGQRDIGELAGLSRESVAKVIKEFKARSLVEVNRGATTILDMAELRRRTGTKESAANER